MGSNPPFTAFLFLITEPLKRIMTPRPTFDVFNDDFAQRIVGRTAKSGIDGFLGVTVTGIEAGSIDAEFDVSDDKITMMGSMHGGCLAAFCDHLLGVIMYPVMPAGYWAATTEFKLNYLAPVSGGVCRAHGDIVAMSRRLGVVRIDVENDGRLVCVAQGTCTIVAPKAS